MGLFKKSKNNLNHNHSVQYPKCNCDGCPKQENCQYGHVNSDWLDGSRLSLVDKFILVNGDLEPAEPPGIATLSQRHDLQKLRALNKECLQETLKYLEQLRQFYYTCGKCGPAYFRFMNIQGELRLVKQALKEYDSYHENLKKLSLVHPYILKELDSHDFILQKDVYKKFDMIEKRKVSKVITRMEEKGLINTVKYSGTYKLVRCDHSSSYSTQFVQETTPAKPEE